MGAHTNELLNRHLSILKGHARKEAIQGALIAIGAIAIGSLAVAFVEFRQLSIDGIFHAQARNFALWVLDTMAFVYPLLGQYSSRTIVHEATTFVRDQTEELRERAERLEQEKVFAATHDPVTELPNRSLFYQRVERSIQGARRDSRSLALLVLQVENFKDIQDALGSAKTDLVLKQLAARFLETTRERDSVARLDSQRFSVLLEGGTGQPGAEQAASRLQKALEPLFHSDRLKLPVHASVGIALFPAHGEDADSLVRHAGAALHAAGQSHNGYAVYSPELDAHSPRRLTLMGDLQHALEYDHLELYYQPKADIGAGRIVGAEALLRWQHPGHGFIPPDEFIIQAERTRLIKPLTQWVMERAFRDAAAWRSDGLDLVVSINLSIKNLQDPEFPDRIVGAMAKTGAQADWFIFEITESSIIVDPERVLDALHRIHSLGFGLSIDDFGTGYSSLAYLKKLPVSELKIDKSFVMDMLNSDNDAVIVRATVELAHNLGLSVTAEGVESAGLMRALQDFRCDIAQGYYLSRPLPAGEFRRWLGASQWSPREAEYPVETA
jgi:diguanylate cyclase (GGDEF)-like protein